MTMHQIVLLGLLLNAVGSGLLISFPLQVRVVTPQGEPLINFVANANSRKQGQRYAFCSKLGPVLLTVGFVFQFAAAVCSRA